MIVLQKTIRVPSCGPGRWWPVAPVAQGHAESMHNLGVKLYFGEGMDSDRRGILPGHPAEKGPKS